MRKFIALTVVLSLALFAGCKDKSPEERAQKH